MRISTENSACAEYLISSIGQKFTCDLKVFTDYSEAQRLSKEKKKKNLEFFCKT